MSNQVDQAEFISLQAALAGRYSLQRELGRGGMGVVYLAHDVALDRPVALKLLQPALATQPELKQRFLTEARTAARLSHPNIIPIFSVDAVDDFVFFVMAFVDGETLGQRVRSRGPVPPTELAKILREVGWGLAYAHAQGVVHRDVKADNIMIEKGSGRALVVDFGIARVVQNTGVTGAGEILGTADYMSPEQASGEPVDQRSDIYSLGIVAFYALTGRLPFEAPTVGAMLAKQITQAPPAIADYAPGVPARLADAVRRCLEKDPAARFATAEELADAVGSALEARKESPGPIRIFTKRANELSQNLVFIGYLQAFIGSFGAVAAMTPDRLGANVLLGLAAIGFTTYPMLAIGMLSQMRRLLKSGYTRDDLIAGWKRESASEWEEGRVEHGGRAGPLERLGRWGMAAGVVGAAVSWPLRFNWGYPEIGLNIGSVGWSAIGLFGLINFWEYDRRTSLSQRVASWFVRSAPGRWAFRVAGVGLDRNRLAAQGTQRHTELALGMAVDSLFGALPKQTRLELAELPLVVRRLEADAMKIRQRLEQLNDAGARLGSPARGAAGGTEGAAGIAADRRDALDRDLDEARTAAKNRLAEAVTALETIRLDLLRMTAGAGSVDSLTADLTEARAVSEQVSRLLEARADVEAALAVYPGREMLPEARHRL